MFGWVLFDFVGLVFVGWKVVGVVMMVGSVILLILWNVVKFWSRV